MKNTPKKGAFRHIVFKDGDTWYAVALEFNIVESADDPRLAFMSLLQAVDGYIQSFKRIRGAMNFEALNQKSDLEYEKLWSDLHSSKPIKSPFEINMYGVAKV
ncbi:MAG: hypothetical protein A2928_01010 [Candidatus Taylorbacteria bacterium RIFCSPLOWO2_01_FULL_45_15b]|uniref:Uncharacterized protein n=1 Tax=Candidatus Taylorbacteria bacterium RIFCSPLOWO2_01_FULL_45_15b TaxID=1802319 RepID=A0A1G2N7T5_9BACT|nr:MAG: hypothetical protein A2928_01010 [Candidatus Taylorbacteria bacterium RIFCSPLOWO2_01_FULL_45_15b]